MAVIDLVNLETAPDEVKLAAQKHLAKGYKMTNEKRTLLHNTLCFEALEGMSYALSAELKRFVTSRAANLYEYAISLSNDCLVCSAYYKQAMKQFGITDFFNVDFTEDEKLLIDYARAIVNDRKHIPDELFARLKKRFSQEAIVVITTMGMFMIANNYFNDVLQVQSEFLSHTDDDDTAEKSV